MNLKTKNNNEKLAPGSVNNLRSSLENLKILRKNVIEFLKDQQNKHGDLVTIFYRNNRAVYFINHPNNIKEVLINQHQNLIQGEGHKFLRFLLGKGLLTVNEPEHHEQRKIIQPEFHRKRIESYFQIMKDETYKFISNWKNDQKLDIHDEMTKLTLNVVSKSLFGTIVDEDISKIRKADHFLNEHIMKSLLTPFGRYKIYFPLPSTIKVYLARNTFNKIVNKLIKSKAKEFKKNILNNNNLNTDLITMLLEIYKKDKNRNKKVRDQTMTFFMAGHETTAKLLTWTWYLLSKNKNINININEELKNVLQDRDLTLDDLPNLIYTKKVIKEILRLYPPAWSISRTAKNDFNINGYKVRKGYGLLISPFLTHRDPRFFESPNDFIPERWTEEFEKNLPKCAYFPFGAGPRLCIGEAFANMEALVIISIITKKFEIELTPKNLEVEIQSHVTLAPKKGMPVIIKEK